MTDSEWVEWGVMYRGGDDSTGGGQRIGEGERERDEKVTDRRQERGKWCELHK